MTSARRRDPGEGMPHREDPMTSGGPSVSDLEPRRRVPRQDPASLAPDQTWTNSVPLQILMLYDMDACHGPTGCDPARACTARAAVAPARRRARTGLGADGSPGRAGLLVVARRLAAAGTADPDPRPLAMVADQALAAAGLDRSGRLGVLSGGVLDRRPVRAAAGRDQP